MLKAKPTFQSSVTFLAYFLYFFQSRADPRQDFQADHSCGQTSLDAL